MQVIGTGHWDGDPELRCELLTVTGGTEAEQKKLARLYRLLKNPETRDRVLELAARVEAEEVETLAPAPGTR